MRRNNWILAALAVAIMALAMVHNTRSQESSPSPPPDWEAGAEPEGPGPDNAAPEMAGLEGIEPGAAGPENGELRQGPPSQPPQQQMKELLEVSEEGWNALRSAIEKVQSLQRQIRAPMGPGGPLGRGRGAASSETGQPQGEVQSRADQLRALLEDKGARAQEDLEKARRDLKGIATAQQEARLVMMGLLE